MLFVAILEQTGQLGLQRLLELGGGFHRTLNRFVDLDQFVDRDAVHGDGALQFFSLGIEDMRKRGFLQSN